jgi:EAL domain-containing protein (putative c-di-GMP-specific phosphodiesterase class I)
MSVNLSVKQFVDPSFAVKLEGLLQEWSLPEGTLKLELTESGIMSDSAAALAILQQFKALGVSLAIDDFGTGYSSLSYLNRFPLDTLKIDRSFTDAMRTEGKDESLIARTIMPLAQHLGLDVVAEGVETIEQAVLLKELHCKYAQGFLFSRPLAPEDVQKLLAKTAVPSNGRVPSLRAFGEGSDVGDLHEELASAKSDPS